MGKLKLQQQFYHSIEKIITQARNYAYRAVNFAMVQAYWNVGRLIVEEEQKGEERAEYGAFLIQELSKRLTAKFGKGFNERNLFYFKQFYLKFPIVNAVRAEFDLKETLDQLSDSNITSLRKELSWTHYRILLTVEDAQARYWYMNEAANCGWSTRALERQIRSLYYQRLLMSRNKKPVIEEMKANTNNSSAEELIKDPYVLEFLGLPDQPYFRESDLEQAIIDKLQNFLLEMGRGFAFVARQKRIQTETKEFYIDLVFYNYILKCFVLIDLKTHELTHEDIGQMDMYVRIFEDKIKGKEDNPTVGLILCTEKDQTIVKYSVLNENRQLFASKYRLFLPSEEELRKELELERKQVVREAQAKYRISKRQL